MLLNYRKIPQTSSPADKLALQLTLEIINRYVSPQEIAYTKVLTNPNNPWAYLWKFYRQILWQIWWYFMVFYGKYDRFLRWILCLQNQQKKFGFSVYPFDIVRIVLNGFNVFHIQIVSCNLVSYLQIEPLRGVPKFPKYKEK